MFKTVRSFLITLLAALFVIVSATWVFISFVKSRPNGFPTDLLLKQYDLPRGFQRKEFLSVDVPNAEALAIGYVVPDGSKFPGVRVSHRLAMYADEQSAQAAYPGWEKELFPVDEWKTPDDFDFKPTDSDDLYRFACMPGYFDGQDYILCRYVQQHKNMISDVMANLDGQFLKLEDVEKLLASLDARLSQK
jgi:hypothetical protein